MFAKINVNIPEVTMERECTICKETKLITEFIADKHKQDGYRNQCKACRRARQKETYEDRKDGQNKRLRTFRSTIKGATHVSYHACMRRAKKEGIPFSVTLEYLRGLYEKQDGKCAMTGVTLVVNGGWNSPSLDKMDPKLGYVEGNVQWLTKKMNTVKQDFTVEEFKELCKTILENTGA